MEFLLETCIRFANWASLRLAPRRYRQRAPNGLAGVALFFFLVVGVPILAVLWGYATGRLPAPSPYPD